MMRLIIYTKPLDQALNRMEKQHGHLFGGYSGENGNVRPKQLNRGQYFDPSILLEMKAISLYCLSVNFFGVNCKTIDCTCTMRDHLLTIT